MEIAHVEDLCPLRARGTQIGATYELRYELEEPRLRAEIVGGPAIELELEADCDHFDLAFSPLFNSLPVLAGLDDVRDCVMTFISVPDLAVSRSEQRYERLGPRTVRYQSDSFTAELELDEEGFVLRYPGLAERIGPS
jgi:hypothetical protein